MAPAKHRRRTRLQVIDPYVVAHVIQHPARGTAWSLRELARVVGCSKSLLGHLRAGTRGTIDPDVARRFSQAVGVEVPVLFLPVVSTDSDDKVES